jgi:molybdate transport system substrate-binding protein
MAVFAAIVLAACQVNHDVCACAELAPPPFLIVYAAASLQPAFDKVGKLAVDRRIATPNFRYGGTQSLVREVIGGANGDVFASADRAYMSTLQGAGFVDGQPSIFAHNSLEIVVAKGNPKHIQTLADLSRPGLVVVLADPSVPAGTYAQQALSKAHVTVRPASLELQVTAVLNKVALGEADAGIVYVSDVVTSGKVGGVTIPDDQNVVADYPIAVLKQASRRTVAQTFIDLVLSADGQAILKAAGFQAA